LQQQSKRGLYWLELQGKSADLMYDYGMAIGISFQIVDDALDYSDEKKLESRWVEIYRNENNPSFESFDGTGKCYGQKASGFDSFSINNRETANRGGNMFDETLRFHRLYIGTLQGICSKGSAVHRKFPGYRA